MTKLTQFGKKRWILRDDSGSSTECKGRRWRSRQSTGSTKIQTSYQTSPLGSASGEFCILFTIHDPIDLSVDNLPIDIKGTVNILKNFKNAGRRNIEWVQPDWQPLRWASASFYISSCWNYFFLQRGDFFCWKSILFAETPGNEENREWLMRSWSRGQIYQNWFPRI